MENVILMVMYVSRKMGIDLAYKNRLGEKNYGMSVMSMRHNIVCVMIDQTQKKKKTEKNRALAVLAVMREIVRDRTAAGPHETKWTNNKKKKIALLHCYVPVTFKP